MVWHDTGFRDRRASNDRRPSAGAARRDPHGVPVSGDGSASLRAGLLGAWLVGVDVWVKLVARLGACPGASTAAWDPWSPPTSCGAIDLAGGIALAPAVREGLPGVSLADPLSRQLVALAVIAAVTIATIVIGRGRARQPADLLALGCLWAGAMIWGAPILAGPGVAFTEFAVGGAGLGVGDLAMAAGAVWLIIERVRA